MDDQQQTGRTDVIVLVRFAPDGTVTEISARPETVPPQTWFNALSAKFGSSFRALTGGRATFVISADALSDVANSLSKQ